MLHSTTIVDEHRGYHTGVEIPNGVYGMSKRIDSLSNFMDFTEPNTQGVKEVWAMVGEDAKFQLILSQRLIVNQVQMEAEKILNHYGHELRNLQIFVLASGGFVYGKMLFDALAKMNPKNLPRFFSLRTRTYEGTSIAPSGVKVDTDSAYHIYFQNPGDGSNPEDFCRGLLHNDQLNPKSPVLVLDDVLDSGHTIQTVRKGLGQIFHKDEIGTAFLVEKPSGLKTETDPRSEKAFNTSGIIVLGNPWLAGGGMDSGVGSNIEKRISRVGFGSGGIWAKV